MVLVNEYSQQIRYHRAIGVTRFHRMIFIEELVWEIKNGKNYKIIILMMDAKKNMNKGKLVRRITNLVMK